MRKNPWGFELPDYVFETQRTLNNLTATLEAANRVSQALSFTQNLSGAFAAVESFQSVLRTVYSNTTFDSLAKSATVMQSALDNVQMPAVVDMIPTIEKLLPVIDTTWKVPSIDWDWLSKTLATFDGYNYDDIEELITDEIREELNESVHKTFSADDSQKNIEQRYGDWKEKHPLLADIYLQLVAIFLSAIFGLFNNWLTGFTTKDSKVYESPAATSNVIVNVDINQNITIINEVPYYYEVIYTVPETGEEKKGYIYKPNVIIQQEDNEHEMQKSKFEPQ